MSSRNVYLSARQRAAAPIIHRALEEARSAFSAGERNAAALRSTVAARLSSEPLAQAEYISLADSATLDELDGNVTSPALLSVVVRFGPTRLLDNIELA